MKAVSAAAAALLVARVAGTDAISDTLPRTEVEAKFAIPPCLVDASDNDKLVSDCCAASDDFDCGAGYVKLSAFADDTCQSAVMTTCTRLGLKDVKKCGYDEIEAIPPVCPEAKTLLVDSGAVQDVSDDTC